jgi:hypothetical protein
MKKLITIVQIYALIAYLCSPAFASKATIVKGDVSEGLGNGLVNASFEAATVATGWTAGSNVSSAVNTSSYVDGKQSLTLSASATFGSAQVLWYQDWTPGSSLSPNNGEASLYVNTTASTLQVCPRVQGTTLLNQCVSVPGTGNWAKVSTNFIFPSSGNVGVALYSTAGFLSGATIGSIDKGYVGFATNLGQVSQAQDIGSLVFAGTAGCTWAITQNTYAADFASNASCATATISNGSPLTSPGKVPQATYLNAQPGSYKVTWTSRVDQSADSSPTCRIVDDLGNTLVEQGFDTNTSTAAPLTLTGKWTYTQAGSRTWKVQCKWGSVSAAITLAGTDTRGSAGFQVEYFPTQSQTGYRADQTPASWSGYNDTTCNWTRTSTAIGDFTADATCNLVESTNRNFGTVTAVSGVLPGVTFTPPRAGRYFVCAYPQVYSAVNYAVLNIRLTDGTTTIAEAGTRIASDGTTTYQTQPLCGIYNATSTSSVSLKLQGASTSGAIGIQASSVARSSIEWSIVELDAPMPAPYLTGSVVQLGSGILRDTEVSFGANTGLTSGCTASPCTISTNSTGDVTNVTRTGTGVYSINLGTAYSSVGSCTCSIDGDQSIGAQCQPSRSASSASALVIKTFTSGGAAADTAVHAHCWGPR